MLARYEGAYAATTVTVMGDRRASSGRTAGPRRGGIDDLVAAKWERIKIQPSGLCTDAEFLRRVHLDLTGLPPSPTRCGPSCRRPRQPRPSARLVDRLIGSPNSSSTGRTSGPTCCR
jgi:hypothetical protein